MERADRKPSEGHRPRVSAAGNGVDIIKTQPRFASIPYVLAGRYRGAHYSNYGNGKATFDASLPKMPAMGLHDLRRTAKSLMARAGVRPDISERVLGHEMGAWKASTTGTPTETRRPTLLRALAGGLIDSILRPPSSNVVSLAK